MKLLLLKIISKNWKNAWIASGGIFEVDQKIERLQIIQQELEDPNIWNQPEKTQALGKERAVLEEVIGMMSHLRGALLDASQLYELAFSENDTDTIEAITQDALDFTKKKFNLHV